jgi:LPS-assembly lipoprotein
MKKIRAALLIVLVLLAGCGFHLRGTETLPFKSAVVEAAAASALAPLLSQALQEQAKLAAKPEEAQLRIRITNETRGKSILSLSGSGRVREYRIEYKLTAVVVDTFGVEVLAPFSIQLANDFSYSDDQVLAKQAEEASLYRSMEQEILRQVLRRLSFIKHT